ncbi:MAG: tellurite resistance TerB family protein [Candidatus Heimdallarchaeota archaeon]|nr:tellurite resistance TerB family protein [Candidatus Heimdallarchaeota archaeon]MCK5049828.1 tellurite resistance TerB family protein [Candidatus Heimdallarchaeota archaeon]
MGLFDKFFNVDETSSKQVNLSKEESFLGILIAASASDGHLSKIEFLSISRAFNSSKMFSHLTEMQLKQMYERIFQMLQSNGVGNIIHTASKVLSQELKETVFALAIDIVLADGIVDANEKQFLDKLQAAIGINEALATKIVEVMIIKNRT